MEVPSQRHSEEWSDEESRSWDQDSFLYLSLRGAR